MKKRILSMLLCLAMTAGLLMGCGGSNADSSDSSVTAESGSAENSSEAAEEKVVRLGMIPSSGHVLSAIAENQGYYEEEGITIEYINFNTADDAFSSLAAGKVDVLSTYGTNMPLAYIAAGEDVTIFSGYMLTGAMTIVAQEDTEWDGIESIVGKVFAGPGIAAHQITGPLLDLGYDPVNDVEWLDLSSSPDRIEAVRSGKADYAMLATGLGQQAEEAGLKIVSYCSDVMPEYSCCRAVANTDWLNEDSDTVKSLLKCWIRALQYFESDREACVSLVAEQIDADEDYVSGYLLDEHYRLQVDPAYAIVERAWDIDKKTGVVESDDDSLLTEHFNSDLYKAALDECIKEHYDDDPEYYDNCSAYYEENDV